MSPVKVLVVDDSLFMRTVLTDILSSDSGIKVVGTARNGKVALELIPKLKPDLITLDIEMPVLDGITTLKTIMKTNPLPVIMLSSLTREGAKQTLEALEIGAVDYIPKPTGSSNIGYIKETLIQKIVQISSTQMKLFARKHKRSIKESVPRITSDSNKVVVLGASTGGPLALTNVLSSLPNDLPPLLIVQHMPKPFTTYFAERLEKATSFEVREAAEGDRLSSDLALLAPAGSHMTVTKRKRIHLHKGPVVYNLRPTVDEMMVSTAKVFGSKTIGVILTGMGSDGVKGMQSIKKYGGLNIAQDEETSVVYGMPKAAYDAGVVDIVLPLNKIPREIVKRCH